MKIAKDLNFATRSGFSPAQPGWLITHLVWNDSYDISDKMWRWGIGTGEKKIKKYLYKEKSVISLYQQINKHYVKNIYSIRYIYGHDRRKPIGSSKEGL